MYMNRTTATKKTQQWEVHTVFSESGVVATLGCIVTFNKQKTQHNKQQCEN